MDRYRRYVLQEKIVSESYANVKQLLIRALLLAILLHH